MPDTILPEIYSVHEAADVYPMILGDELQQLADDIKANGQLEPIIFTTDPDGEPVLVDGRNRLAACGMAEVQPVIEWRDFADDKSIRVYILSKNENRRHMNAGQRAMCVAKIWPKGNADHVKKSVSDSFSLTRLKNARFINKWLDGKDVSLVISGVMSFSDAMDAAKKNRDDSIDIQEAVADLPDDLRNLVMEKELKLAEAVAAKKARLSEEKNKRSTYFNLLEKSAVYAGRGWDDHDLSLPRAAYRDYPEEFTLFNKEASVRDELVMIIKNTKRMLKAYDQEN